MCHILWVKLNGPGLFGYGWGTWKYWKYWKRSGTRFWVKLCHSPSTIFLKNCLQFFVHKPVMKLWNSLKNCFIICNHIVRNFCVKNERRNGSKFNWKFVTVWNKRVPNLSPKYCTKNSWIWCRFLVSSFAQKLVPIGRPIFVSETGQYFEKISEPVVCKVERFEVSPKAFSCVKFCRHHFEKFLFIFVKSDSSAKHSTSEFCSKNLKQNCSENFGQKYTFWCWNFCVKFCYEKKIELVQNLQQFDLSFSKFFINCFDE